MLLPRIARILTWVTIGLAPLRRALGGEPITVALTLTERKGAGPEQQLGENLLALADLAVQSDKSLAVVERRQIASVIQEQVLDRSPRADPQLQLGKLLTADYLAMLEMLPREQGTPKAWGSPRRVPAAGRTNPRARCRSSRSCSVPAWSSCWPSWT